MGFPVEESGMWIPCDDFDIPVDVRCYGDGWGIRIKDVNRRVIREQLVVTADVNKARQKMSKIIQETKTTL